MNKDNRKLKDLVSIGPAMLEDFKKLNVKTVSELSRKAPSTLYERLSKITGIRQDPCVLDTFSAAVAQARNPRLPKEQCQWWYWSRIRKKKTVKGRR